MMRWGAFLAWGSFLVFLGFCVYYYWAFVVGIWPQDPQPSFWDIPKILCIVVFIYGFRLYSRGEDKHRRTTAQSSADSRRNPSHGM